MAKRIVPLVLALSLAGYFGYRAWEKREAEKREDFFSGTVEAEEVVVSAQLAGRIVELNVEEGDTVQAGELLGRLDKTLYQAQVEQAEAAHKAVRGQELVINANLEIVDTHLGRAQRLYEAKAGPRASAEDLAKQRQVLLAQKEALRLQAAQAEAALELARKQLSYTEITAPISGTVLRVHAELGEMAFPGSALLTLADLSQVEIRIYIPEPMLGKIKVGDPAEIRTDTFPDRLLPAKVARIAENAEFTPKNVQTRDERVRLVYAVTLRADNPEGIFKIGMPAEARFVLPAVSGGDSASSP